MNEQAFPAVKVEEVSSSENSSRRAKSRSLLTFFVGSSEVYGIRGGHGLSMVNGVTGFAGVEQAGSSFEVGLKEGEKRKVDDASVLLPQAERARINACLAEELIHRNMNHLGVGDVVSEQEKRRGIGSVESRTKERLKAEASRTHLVSAKLSLKASINV